MANFGTNVGEKFAKNTLKIFFENAIAPDITNQDYEGEIKGGGADRLNVLTFGALSLKIIQVQRCQLIHLAKAKLNLS